MVKARNATLSLVKNVSWKPAIVLLIGFYAMLFYGLFNDKVDPDLPSFYSSGLALDAGNNPYEEPVAFYLPVIRHVGINLNPPAFLWVLRPLAYFSYQVGLIIWSTLSFILGLVGAGIAFYYAFSTAFLKKNWLYLYSAYLASFGVIINTAFAQVGCMLLFFLMMGYHFFLKKRDFAASVCWGLIIAVKLFPALLFVYVLIQQRYRLFAWMSFIGLLLTVIPWIQYGDTLYRQYLHMMSCVHWFGWNYNASIFGYILRLLVDPAKVRPPGMWLCLLYGLLFGIALIFYCQNLIKYRKQDSSHQGFGLTLVMMLLLSPLGWIYYFPILVLPISFTAGIRLTSIMPYNATIWLLCVLLLNAPTSLTPKIIEGTLWDNLGVHSLHFYGLLLLTYLSTQARVSHHPNGSIYHAYAYRYTAFFVLLVVYILLIKRLLGC